MTKQAQSPFLTMAWQRWEQRTPYRTVGEVFSPRAVRQLIDHVRREAVCTEFGDQCVFRRCLCSL